MANLQKLAEGLQGFFKGGRVADEAASTVKVGDKDIPVDQLKKVEEPSDDDLRAIEDNNVDLPDSTTLDEDEEFLAQIQKELLEEDNAAQAKPDWAPEESLEDVLLKSFKEPSSSGSTRRRHRLDELYSRIKPSEEMMNKAKQLKFHTDRILFHGTKRNIKKFKVSHAGKSTDAGWFGKGVYFSEDPDVAGGYASSARPDRTLKDQHGPNIIPVFVRGNMYETDIGKTGDFPSPKHFKDALRRDFGDQIITSIDNRTRKLVREHLKSLGIDRSLEDNAFTVHQLKQIARAESITAELKKRGYDGIMLREGNDNFIVEAVIFDPKNIRSVNAKFDRRNIHSPVLKHAVGGTVITTAAMNEAEGALHGQDAIAKVEELEGTLTELQKAIVVEEGYSDNPYTDDAGSRGLRDKGVETVGVGQTGKFKNMTFKEAFAEKLAETKRMVPGFDELSEEQKKAFISLHYRGDLAISPTFLELWNSGKREEAAEELLNHEEYEQRKAMVEQTGKADGVVNRLEHNQQRLLSG